MKSKGIYISISIRYSLRTNEKIYRLTIVNCKIADESLQGTKTIVVIGLGKHKEII
jgi:hypothetical protein